ncbi:AAA family ATPase [Nesterenkonia sp. F]|uniref:AAA family ATPase n=1 Tax=Nesterenkonia sp. F TaxID=795955 RepID=UPI000255CE92|nr:AAA family ATPase [Nesterenkonia sp. F]
MRRCSVVTTGHLHQDHIAAIEGLHSDVTVDRRCSDLVELVAAARAGRADAALIIGGTEDLTDSRLAELHEDGVVVVAISDLADERRRLAALGITALPDEIDVHLLVPALRGEEVEPPEELDAELEALVAAEGPSDPEDGGGPAGSEHPEDSPEAEAGDTPPGRGGMDGSDPAAGAAPADAGSGPAADAFDAADAAGADVVPRDLGGAAKEDGDDGEASARATGPRIEESVDGLDGGEADEDGEGSDSEEPPSETSDSPVRGITVVWGAPGSPGRTTTAVNMAAELAGTGRRVLLIDADTVAASAAVQLGLIEESAGLAQACRQADLGRLDSSRLRRIVTLVDVAGWRMHVLTGLPRADRWRELRERGLRQVLRIARDEYDHVVVDVSASIEQDEDLTYDTFAPQRHAAAVAALEEADTVLAVGAADPVSFPRLVKSLEERRLLVPEAPEPQVVINQLRAQAVGRSPEEQIAEAWAHWGAAATIIRHLPWEREACDVALLRGQVLAEAAPGSELRRGIAALAGVVLPERRRGLFGRPRGGERRSRRRAARRGRGGRRRAESSESSEAASVEATSRDSAAADDGSAGAGDGGSAASGPAASKSAPARAEADTDADTEAGAESR